MLTKIQSEFQFKNWNHTIRSPTDAFAANATSREDAANNRISKQQPNNRDMLYKLLTTYQPFNNVSTKANGGSVGNLETLHDGIHNSFGLGNMGIIEMSAFDPVFWFHHWYVYIYSTMNMTKLCSNMDRIITMYQTRYPDTWIEDAKQVKGTFTTPRGAVLGPASPLAPFHMNALGDMWTATTTRNWTFFGYTYPELASNPSNATLTATINKLYGPKHLNTTTPSAPTAPSGSPNGTNATAAPSIDWLCEVKMPVDISISYSVRAFLGTPPADPRTWATDPSYVGQLSTLSSPRMKSDVHVTGTIPLTERLSQAHANGSLASLDKETVAAYLKTHFTWRIQALDFSEIPRSHPPAGLAVSVFNVPIAQPASNTDVPTWSGPAEHHADIAGNPPADNGNVPAADADSAAGAYDAESREWVWHNGTDVVGDSGEGVGTKIVHVTAIETAYVTVEAPAEAEVTAAPGVDEESEGGPQTRFVTSQVVQYVTVLPGQ
jgi:tyrosinase